MILLTVRERDKYAVVKPEDALWLGNVYEVLLPYPAISRRPKCPQKYRQRKKVAKISSFSLNKVSYAGNIST